MTRDELQMMFAKTRQYVEQDSDGKYRIREGCDLEDVLCKLHFYETVKPRRWMEFYIHGNYRVGCSSFEEYVRIWHALDLSIDDFLKACPNVTTRTRNALKKANIHKVKDLIIPSFATSMIMITKIPGVGEAQYLELQKAIQKLENLIECGYDEDDEFCKALITKEKRE